MMDVGVTEIISACMSLGMMVTMNQRLDAETLSIVAEEFGYDVEFITADIEESIQEIEDKEEDLAKTLLDMSMNYSQSTGQGVAQQVLSNIGEIAKLHKKYVEKAGFVVLKSPDVPSILVETGFISNPQEAAKLRTKSYQKQMAKAIFNGLKSYFYSHPVTNTYVASVVEAKRKLRSYKVVSGDTLSAIAQRFGTTVKRLQSANKMTSKSVLLVGKTLVIPTS